MSSAHGFSRPPVAGVSWCATDGPYPLVGVLVPIVAALVFMLREQSGKICCRPRPGSDTDRPRGESPKHKEVSHGRTLAFGSRSRTCAHRRRARQRGAPVADPPRHSLWESRARESTDFAGWKIPG